MRSKSVGPALAVLFLVNVLNFYDRQTLAAILEPLRHEFSLSDTQLGGLFTLFTVVFALAGLPLGKLADTHSRRGLLAGGIAVWTALTGMAGLATSYAMLLGTRLGVGIGEAVCTPAATSWIGDLVPAFAAGGAMAGFMVAVPVGIMLSSAIGGPVAQAHGWPDGAAGGGDPGLVLVPAVLWLSEPERPTVPDGGGGTGALPAVFWWIAASGAVVNFALYSFSDVSAGVSDVRYHGMSVAQAGVWTGIGSGVSGILGAVAAGLVGDPGEESPVAGGGRLAGGGGSGVRRDSHAGGERGARGVAGDDGVRLTADVLRAGVRGDSGCHRARGAGSRDGRVLRGDVFRRGVVGAVSDGAAERFSGAAVGSGGGGVSRGGAAQRDVRDSGAGGSAGSGALDGGTSASCGEWLGMTGTSGARCPICGVKGVMAGAATSKRPQFTGAR